MNKKFENVIVLLTGIAGVGKRTIAEAMYLDDSTFRCVLCDSWLQPILQLLGDEPTVMHNLSPAGWAAINKVRDEVFYTISNICPRETNFVITQELIEGNAWHKSFYESVEAMAKQRDSTFIPVRLTCDVPVLLTRVVAEDRKNFYKTRDADMVRDRALSTEALKSKNIFELTLDTTSLSPRESAAKIFQHINSVING